MKNFTHRFLWIIPVLLLTLAAKGLFAQEVMRVNMKDGTVMEFAIDDIRKLTFDNSSGLFQYSETVGQLLTMKAFPNPASDRVNIAYSLSSAGEVTVEIFNMNGLRLESFDRGYQETGEYLYQWHLPEIPSGIYICRIRQGKEIVSEKIIVKK